MHYAQYQGLPLEIADQEVLLNRDCLLAGAGWYCAKVHFGYRSSRHVKAVRIAYTALKNSYAAFPYTDKTLRYARTRCSYNIECQDSREGLAVAGRRASRRKKL